VGRAAQEAPEVERPLPLCERRGAREDTEGLHESLKLQDGAPGVQGGGRLDLRRPPPELRDHFVQRRRLRHPEVLVVVGHVFGNGTIGDLRGEEAALPPDVRCMAVCHALRGRKRLIRVIEPLQCAEGPSAAQEGGEVQGVHPQRLVADGEALRRPPGKQRRQRTVLDHLLA
jgi:hypothetical protein